MIQQKHIQNNNNIINNKINKNSPILNNQNQINTNNPKSQLNQDMLTFFLSKSSNNKIIGRFG